MAEGPEGGGLEAYRAGMRHDEVRVVLAGLKPVLAVSRPAKGWGEAGETRFKVAQEAMAYEQKHPHTLVQTCEIYWVQRDSSVPLAVGGVWFDYLFFDRDDRLLGSARRLME